MLPQVNLVFRSGRMTRGSENAPCRTAPPDLCTDCRPLGECCRRAASRIPPAKSLGPYRERAGQQRPGNGRNARGRRVHDTATCKPPRGLAGQLLCGDSIDRVCLAILTRRWGNAAWSQFALPNAAPPQSTAKRFSTSPLGVKWAENALPCIWRVELRHHATRRLRRRG